MQEQDRPEGAYHNIHSTANLSDCRCPGRLAGSAQAQAGIPATCQSVPGPAVPQQDHCSEQPDPAIVITPSET